MRKLLSRPAESRGTLAGSDAALHGAPRFLLATLFLGVAVGGVVGAFASAEGLPAELESYAASRFLARDLPTALLSSSRFFLLLLLAATSYLGVVLTPALVFLRGYLLSCSVAALYTLFSFRGLTWALLLFGLPALVLIPCFYCIACDAFSVSQRLLGQRLGRGGAPAGTRLLRRVPLILTLTALDGLYGAYLLPRLLSKF